MPGLTCLEVGRQEELPRGKVCCWSRKEARMSGGIKITSLLLRDNDTNQWRWTVTMAAFELVMVFSTRSYGVVDCVKTSIPKYHERRSCDIGSWLFQTLVQSLDKVS